ncbi:MAG: Phage tail length tape-measure protein [Patescibacteria group bacterium]|nr:Phage tail length tape-measure protein [Patescibacteria group bacterium]
MRNISKLVATLLLLVTQVRTPILPILGDVAAAVKAPVAEAAGVYEVKLNTNSAVPLELVPATKQPDYEAEVLAPLHQAQAEAAAKAEAKAAQVAAAKAKVAAHAKASVVTTVVLPAGSHTDWMREAGIAESDFGFVDYIIDHESGWGVTKSNYAGSGAYGLGQAMPAGKMAKFGDDYLTNPVTQLKWANAYAVGSYGSWAGAYSHWAGRHNW